MVPKKVKWSCWAGLEANLSVSEAAGWGVEGGSEAREGLPEGVRTGSGEPAGAARDGQTVSKQPGSTYECIGVMICARFRRSRFSFRMHDFDSFFGSTFFSIVHMRNASVQFTAKGTKMAELGGVMAFAGY